MQPGEALASDCPIMIATARIGIIRIVIAKAASTFIEMNTGSLAIFIAIRRASSRVSSLVAERRPGSSQTSPDGTKQIILYNSPRGKPLSGD
jgi:hypothetical protein